MPTKAELQQGIIAAGEANDAEAVKFLSGMMSNMKQAEAPSPGVIPSAVRGAVTTPYALADMGANAVAWPVQSVLKSLNLPTLPPANSAGFVSSRIPIGPPQSAVERTAELAGSALVPGGIATKLTAAGARAPVIASELTSLLGSAVGREAGIQAGGEGSTAEAAGTILGSLSPAGIGAASRYLSIPRKPFTEAKVPEQTLQGFERQDVPASVGDVTDQSYIQSVAKHMPGGHGVFKNLRQRQGEAMKESLYKITKDVDEVDAGLAIQKGIKDYVGGRFKRTSNRLSDNLDKAISPGTPISMDNTRALLDEIEGSKGAFKGSLSVPALKTMAKEIDEAEAAGLTFQAVRKARTAIGHKLMSFDLVSDIPRADLKRIYGSLSKDINAAAEASGFKAQSALKRLNRYWGKGITRVDDFLEPLSKKIASEDTYKALFKSTKDSPTRIKHLSKVLKPAEREVFLDATLRKLGDPTPSARTPEYTFSPETFLTNLNKIDEGNFKALARGTKYQDSVKFDDLKMVAGRLREVDKILKNPSGTAESLLPMLTAGGLGGSMAFGLNVTASALTGVGATVGGSYAVSKMLTNPKFVRWMVRGSRVNAGQFASHLGKLATVLKDEDYATQQAADRLIEFFNVE